MSQIKERYIWAAFIVVIIIGALYFRYFYQPSYSISVNVAAPSGKAYSFQSIPISISVSNNGSATIDNISFGLYINGNTTRIYKAYIPAGKQATVTYNFTPANSGAYKFSVVVDPSNLYNIADRSAAQGSATLTVSPTEKATPYSNFPNGAESQDISLMKPQGYVATLYFVNFTKDFLITGSVQANNFLYPTLDVLASYINNITISHAYYPGHNLTSVWISGYINANTIDAAAQGQGINISQENSVSVMNFGNSTTLCTWYSGGWTKMLISIAADNCTAYTANTTDSINFSSVYYELKNRNISLLNYYGYGPGVKYAGDISANANALVYESLAEGSNFSNICYGLTFNMSNNSFCRMIILQGNTTADQLNRITKSYNLSIWWIPTANATIPALNNAINLSSSYVLPGNSIAFISAYSNQCILTKDITCNNPVFASNTTELRIGINITDNYGSPITLNGVACSLGGTAPLTKLDVLLASDKKTTVYMPCYYSGKEVNSSIVPAGDELYLKLNYTYNNIANTTYGAAYIES